MGREGKIIFIEGVDGCGKSTLVNNLKDKYGDKLCYFREPGSTPAGDKIREILLSDEISTNELTDVLLFTASRCEMYKSNIEKLLEDDNRIIIVDRSVVSTMVYQPMKYVYLNEPEKIKQMHQNIMCYNNFINYDKVIIYYMDVDSDTIVKRLANNERELNKRDSIDKSTIEVIQAMYRYVLDNYFKDKYVNSKNVDLENLIDNLLK